MRTCAILTVAKDHAACKDYCRLFCRLIPVCLPSVGLEGEVAHTPLSVAVAPGVVLLSSFRTHTG